MRFMDEFVNWYGTWFHLFILFVIIVFFNEDDDLIKSSLTVPYLIWNVKIRSSCKSKIIVFFPQCSFRIIWITFFFRPILCNLVVSNEKLTETSFSLVKIFKLCFKKSWNYIFCANGRNAIWMYSVYIRSLHRGNYISSSVSKDKNCKIVRFEIFKI